MTEQEVGMTVDYSYAIAELQNALDIRETNLPYSVLAEDWEQSKLRAASCISFRQAIDALRGVPWHQNTGDQSEL